MVPGSLFTCTILLSAAGILAATDPFALYKALLDITSSLLVFSAMTLACVTITEALQRAFHGRRKIDNEREFYVDTPHVSTLPRVSTSSSESSSYKSTQSSSVQDENAEPLATAHSNVGAGLCSDIDKFVHLDQKY